MSNQPSNWDAIVAAINQIKESKFTVSKEQFLDVLTQFVMQARAKYIEEKKEEPTKIHFHTQWLSDNEITDLTHICGMNVFHNTWIAYGDIVLSNFKHLNLDINRL